MRRPVIRPARRRTLGAERSPRESPVGVKLDRILKVRETRGTIARDVAARITSVDRANPYTHHLPVRLEWTTYSEEVTIQPRGQRELILQLVVAIEVGDKRSYIVRPAVLEDSPTEFTLELFSAPR